MSLFYEHAHRNPTDNMFDNYLCICRAHKSRYRHIHDKHFLLRRAYSATCCLSITYVFRDGCKTHLQRDLQLEWFLLSAVYIFHIWMAEVYVHTAIYLSTKSQTYH